MVIYQGIEQVFAALADPTRRQMLERLVRGDATIGELAAPHDISLPAAMKHVRKLIAAGVVKRTKCGRSVVCSLDTDALVSASRWLDEILAFWNQRLDALANHLARQKEDDE